MQGGEGFAVVQLYGGAYLGGGILHGDAFEGGIVVNDQLVVGGEPYIELGGIAVDGVGFTSAAMEFCAEPAVFQKPRCAMTWVDCACMVPHAVSARAEAKKRFFRFIMIMVFVLCTKVENKNETH